jgi:M6 family metalloprotease-like protein
MIFPIAEAALKAGTNCAKVGLTSVVSGKKYTCIKSGKKLVWDKGVTVLAPTKSNGNQSNSNNEIKPQISVGSSISTGKTTGIATYDASNFNSYRITVESIDDGLTAFQTKIINSSISPIKQAIDGLKCGTRYRTTISIFSLADGKGIEFVSKDGGQLVTEACPVEFTDIVPKAGGLCTKLGSQTIQQDVVLECRFVHGLKLNWIATHAVKKDFPLQVSPKNISVCQLPGKIDGGHITGFQVDRIANRLIPSQGTNNMLIVPIDFPDFPGDQNLDEIISNQKKQLKNWIDYFSGGKLNFNVQSINKWLRAPHEALYYNRVDIDIRGVDGNKLLAAIAQEYVDFITKEIDLRKYQTIYVLYPSKQNVIATDLVPRTTEFKLKEGKTVMSFFARTNYDQKMETPFWAFWIHETAHDWGLVGHAPGNGWPLSLMQNQAGLSLALNAWDRFVLGWMPDSQVYCDALESLTTSEISLSPLERADSSTKMVAIKLTESKLLIVEAHGMGEWALRRPTQYYSFDETGFYGVVAYVVDTQFETGDPIFNADGSAPQDDNGNDGYIKRFAKYYKIDGEASNNYGLNNTGTWNNNAYIAVLGDTFSIEGVKITFTKTGDYETVSVSKS